MAKKVSIKRGTSDLLRWKSKRGTTATAHKMRGHGNSSRPKARKVIK